VAAFRSGEVNLLFSTDVGAEVRWGRGGRPALAFLQVDESGRGVADVIGGSWRLGALRVCRWSTAANQQQHGAQLGRINNIHQGMDFRQCQLVVAFDAPKEVKGDPLHFIQIRLAFDHV